MDDAESGQGLIIFVVKLFLLERLGALNVQEVSD